MTYFERIHNVETNEIVERPFTEEEIAQVEASKAESQAKAQAEEQARLDAEARLSAKLAIYAKLGLTEEEINTLIS
jgi:hypothetical protein